MEMNGKVVLSEMPEINSFVFPRWMPGVFETIINLSQYEYYKRRNEKE